MRLVKNLLILAAFMLPFMQVGAASAQGSGLSISPTRAELEVAAGTVDKISLKIKNVTGGAITARATINDFTADGITGEPQIASDEAEQLPTSVKGFVKNENIELEPDETKDVDVVVDVPADTNPGAYYGVLRYTAVPKDGSGDGQVSLSAGVGVIVLITVPGNVEQKISVSSIKALADGKSGFLLTKSPTQAAITVRNIGTGFAKPFSRVSITNMGGKEVFAYDMNNLEPRANILPNSSREFKDEIKNIKMPGKYTMKATTSIFIDNASSDILISEASFWYVPMWLLIVLGVLLLLLIVGGFLAYRKIRGVNR
jgi:hypothetical protein